MLLPNSFKPLLWSYNFSRIDPDRDKRTIIINTINYGDLSHWQWIVQYYGKEMVKKILVSIPASELRPRARKLAALLFSITSFNNAPRGAQKTK